MIVYRISRSCIVVALNFDDSAPMARLRGLRSADWRSGVGKRMKAKRATTQKRNPEWQ